MARIAIALLEDSSELPAEETVRCAGIADRPTCRKSTTRKADIGRSSHARDFPGWHRSSPICIGGRRRLRVVRSLRLLRLIIVDLLQHIGVEELHGSARRADVKIDVFRWRKNFELEVVKTLLALENH